MRDPADLATQLARLAPRQLTVLPPPLDGLAGFAKVVRDDPAGGMDADLDDAGNAHGARRSSRGDGARQGSGGDFALGAYRKQERCHDRRCRTHMRSPWVDILKKLASSRLTAG